MKPLVCFHADCTDGFAAAFAAWLKLGDDAEYLPMAYNSINTGAELAGMYGPLNNRDVYILDFSFPRDIMEFLFREANRVVWLDHHKTAFEMWCDGYAQGCTFTEKSYQGLHHIRLNDNKSGALLAWEYFHPGTEVPMLIRHIDDRDRWQFQLPGSKELHAALGSMKPWSFEQWDDIYTSESCPATEAGSFYSLLGEGSAILRAQDAAVKSMLKQARKCEIWKLTDDNYEVEYQFKLPGLAVNATLHMSEVGHELANQSGTYGLVWYMAADNKVKLSFRSNAPYDVSALAKALGGGGHAQAAGAECTIEELMSWLR